MLARILRTACTTTSAAAGLAARESIPVLGPAAAAFSRISSAAMSTPEQAQQPDTEGPTIFDKIVSKQIPASIIYEDDRALAFRDIDPQAKVHFLVIPKDRSGLTRLSKATEQHRDLLGHLLYVAQLVAKQEGLEPGFRVVVNDGPQGCQAVPHLHLHVLGGQQLGWPPG